jgi:malic enzyme
MHGAPAAEAPLELAWRLVGPAICGSAKAQQTDRQTDRQTDLPVRRRRAVSAHDVLGHEAAKQGLFENNNIKKREINTHIFRLATPVSGVLPSNKLAASEMTCQCVDVRGGGREGGEGV